MYLLDIGFSHYTDATKIFNVCKPGSSPIRKQVQAAKEEGRHVDCTEGKKTRSLIFSTCDGKIMITSSTVQTSTLNERITRLRNQEQDRNLSVVQKMVELDREAIELLN